MHVLYWFIIAVYYSYIWDKIINRASSANLYFLAYGQGGIQAKNLLQSREDEVFQKLRCLALTESTHTLHSELSFGLGTCDTKRIRLFLEQHAINWVASPLPAPQRVTVFFCMSYHL